MDNDMTLYEIKNVFLSLKKKQKTLKLLSKLMALMNLIAMLSGGFLMIKGNDSSLAFLLFFMPMGLGPFVLVSLIDDHLPTFELNDLNQEENYLEFLNVSLFLIISNNDIHHEKLSEYEDIKEKINYNLAFKKQNLTQLPQKIQDNIKSNKEKIIEYVHKVILNAYEQNIFNGGKIEEILKLSLEEKESLIKMNLSQLKEKAKLDEKKAIEIEKSLGLGNKEEQKALTLKL
jgi:hypothetical protein